MSTSSAHVALVAAVSLLAASVVGCGSPSAPIAQAPSYEPAGQAKCGVVKDHDEPLIIEWPASERANLEALSKRGTVVVRYQGCEMQVLTGCHVARPYGYTPTTPQHERLTIHNEDELFARLPLGAVRLAGELEKSGQLVVAMTIVGTYATDRQLVPDNRLEGECGGATHVVNAMTVGAFEFHTGAAARVGGGAEIPVAGVGAHSETKRTTLNRGGDSSACAQASGQDEQPPYGCGALLRVEVARIAPAEAPAPEPMPEPVAEIPTTPTAEEPLPPGEGPEPKEPMEPAGQTGPMNPVEPSTAPSDPIEPELAAAPPVPTAPADQGEGTTEPSPTPTETADDSGDDGAFWAYLTAGGLAALVVAGVVAGAVIKASEEDEEQYVPQAGGLGEGTLVFGTPVIRW